MRYRILFIPHKETNAETHRRILEKSGATSIIQTPVSDNHLAFVATLTDTAIDKLTSTEYWSLFGFSLQAGSKAKSNYGI